MNKNKAYNTIVNYLVVKCEALHDQYECDAHRIPICVTTDYSKYDEEEYEVYAIYEDGRIKLIRELLW